MLNKNFYKEIDDPRGYLDEFPDPRQWRIFLRRKVYLDRKGLSDLSKIPLKSGFQLHESLYSRKYVPKNEWQHLLFSGPNVLILSLNEHIPFPPTRVEAYWLAVIRYTKEVVDQYITSLPFKTRPDMPWKGTLGSEILYRISEKYKVGTSWWSWYNNVVNKIDCEG